MAIISVLKYEGDNKTFIWKHPNQDFNTQINVINTEIVQKKNALEIETVEYKKTKIKNEIVELEKQKNNLEALQNAIARLIVARREAHGNQAEQARINAKLDKLYNLKYTMLEQAAKAKSE